jgi:trk system potassium uptake protein TrkA
MGTHLAQTMDREGHQVAVVDADPSAAARLGREFRGKFIAGVGIDLGVLTEAGIERADGLASVTGSDDTNLAVSMVARKQYGVPTVVARVFDPGKMQAYSAAGIHVVCPAAWGFRVVRDIMTRPSREIAMTLGHGEIQVVAIRIGRGKVLMRDITSPPEVIPLALVRASTASIPGGATELVPGDIIYMRVPESQSSTFDRLIQGSEVEP